MLGVQDIQVNLTDGIDGLGATALIWAANEGHAEVVELLLGVQDIQVNLVDMDGDTALMMAACEGHVEVVKLLLEKDGIHVNLEALLMAAEGRHGKIVEMLLRRPELRVIQYNGWRPLRRRSNQVATVQLPTGHPCSRNRVRALTF